MEKLLFKTFCSSSLSLILQEWMKTDKTMSQPNHCSVASTTRDITSNYNMTSWRCHDAVWAIWNFLLLLKPQKKCNIIIMDWTSFLKRKDQLIRQHWSTLKGIMYVIKVNLSCFNKSICTNISLCKHLKILANISIFSENIYFIKSNVISRIKGLAQYKSIMTKKNYFIFIIIK